MIGLITVGMLGGGYMLGATTADQPNSTYEKEHTKILYDKHASDRAYTEYPRMQIATHFMWDYFLAGFEFGYKNPGIGKILGLTYSAVSLNFLTGLLIWFFRHASEPPKANQ